MRRCLSSFVHGVGCAVNSGWTGWKKLGTPLTTPVDLDRFFPLPLNCTHQLPLNFTRPCMTHDFFITEKHAVFLEGSLYMAPEVSGCTHARTHIREDKERDRTSEASQPNCFSSPSQTKLCRTCSRASPTRPSASTRASPRALASSPWTPPTPRCVAWQRLGTTITSHMHTPAHHPPVSLTLPPPQSTNLQSTTTTKKANRVGGERAGRILRLPLRGGVGRGGGGGGGDHHTLRHEVRPLRAGERPQEGKLIGGDKQNLGVCVLRERAGG